MTESFFKWLSLPAWLLLGLALVGVILLGLPENALDFLRLKEFREIPKYGATIGGVSLACLVLGVVKGIHDALERIGDRRKRGQARAAVLERLSTLSNEEIAILAFCMITEQRTVYLKATDRGGCSLVAKRLVVRSPGSILELPHTVESFVWDHLNTSQMGQDLVEKAHKNPAISQYLRVMRKEEENRGLWAGV